MLEPFISYYADIIKSCDAAEQDCVNHASQWPNEITNPIKSNVRRMLRTKCGFLHDIQGCEKRPTCQAASGPLWRTLILLFPILIVIYAVACVWFGDNVPCMFSFLSIHVRPVQSLTKRSNFLHPVVTLADITFFSTLLMETKAQ